jgi:hypothetical protein
MSNIQEVFPFSTNSLNGWPTQQECHIQLAGCYGAMGLCLKANHKISTISKPRILRQGGP